MRLCGRSRLSSPATSDGPAKAPEWDSSAALGLASDRHLITSNPSLLARVLIPRAWLSCSIASCSLRVSLLTEARMLMSFSQIKAPAVGSAPTSSEQIVQFASRLLGWIDCKRTGAYDFNRSAHDGSVTLSVVTAVFLPCAGMRPFVFEG